MGVGGIEKVVKRLNGSPAIKTRSVSERYQHADDADLKAAVKRQADGLEKITGSISGIIVDST